MSCGCIIEILTAYMSAPLRACAIQIPVSFVPVQRHCCIFAETCFSLDKVLRHHFRRDCGSTCDSCEATSGERNPLNWM